MKSIVRKSLPAPRSRSLRCSPDGRWVLQRLLSGLLAVCAAAAAAEDSATLYVNGRFHTMDEQLPLAVAMLVEGERIAWVGESAADSPAGAAERIDLGGRFVMPGLIDAHTHPGLVALNTDVFSGWFEADGKAALFTALEQAAESLKGEELAILASWEVAMFLPEGPHKADLDRLFGDTPVVFFDDTGHSFWLNSAALARFGVNRQTEDLSPNLSYFVRDAAGGMTGWVKEFAVLPMLIDALPKERAALREGLRSFLGQLSAQGVTALYDGGNFNAEDRIHDLLAELDRRGQLPVRYHASHHVYAPGQLDGAVDQVRRVHSQHADARQLRFDTVKIHYDGVIEVGTAAMLEPYLDAESNRGAFLADASRLKALLLELDRTAINAHIHSVGDRATREALDAVEQAQAAKGGRLGIEVTLSHLEHVAAADVPRFEALGVHANFTPHWFNGSWRGGSPEMQLGRARMLASQPANTLLKRGANVTFSSDVTSWGEGPRASPFIGIEMGVARKEFGDPDDPGLNPESEGVALADALRAYTVNAARQLGRADELGALRRGHLADFIVLPQSPFETEEHNLHRLKPDAVVLGGRVVAGEL